MKGTVIESADQAGEILREALDRKTPVVVSYRNESGWACLKSRFLEIDEPAKQVVIERPESPNGKSDPEPLSNQYLGLAFRRGHRKCLCACIVVDESPAQKGGQPRLVLNWPDRIQSLQRRAYYRAALPPSMRVKVLVWSGAPADKPNNPGQDRSSLYADMVDISVGGMALASPESDPCPFRDNQTVSCEFHTPDEVVITLEAHIKHTSCKSSGQQLLGFQFMGLEQGETGCKRIRQLTDFVHTISNRSRPGPRRSLPRQPRRI